MSEVPLYWLQGYLTHKKHGLMVNLAPGDGSSVEGSKSSPNSPLGSSSSSISCHTRQLKNHTRQFENHTRHFKNHTRRFKNLTRQFKTQNRGVKLVAKLAARVDLVVHLLPYTPLWHWGSGEGERETRGSTRPSTSTRQYTRLYWGM